jgi:hypothetical protein
MLFLLFLVAKDFSLVGGHVQNLCAKFELVKKIGAPYGFTSVADFGTDYHPL